MRPHPSAEIPHGVDECDAARRRRAAEVGRGQRPKWRQRRLRTRERKRQRPHCQVRILEVSRQRKAERRAGRRHRHAFAPFAGAVRIAPDQDHHDARDEVRDDVEQTHHRVALAGETLHNRRQPHFVAIRADVHQKIKQAEEPHHGAREDIAQTGVTAGAGVDGVRRHAVFDPGPFAVGKPARIVRTVGQNKQHHHPHDDRRDRFEEKEPLPPGQSGDAIHPENLARDRRTDHARRHAAEHEQRENARPILRRIPVRQIQDHAREKTRLRRAQQKAHPVKHRHPLQEHERHRDQAPDDHDPRDPAARPHLVQDEIARDFKNKITDEEEPRTKTEHAVEHRFAHPQHFAQMQLGKTDVDAIDVRDDVTKEEQRNEPPGDLRQHGALFGGVQIDAARGDWNGLAGCGAHEMRGVFPRPKPEANENARPSPVAADVRRLISRSSMGFEPPHVGCYHAPPLWSHQFSNLFGLDNLEITRHD